MTATGFTREQKQIILWRDGDLCCMCRQRATEANHRANRGAGGSKYRNTLPNGCALCTICNGRIESDAEYAAEARRRGVKLDSWDDPEAEPWLSPLYQLPVWSLPNGDLLFERPTRPSMEDVTE